MSKFTASIQAILDTSRIPDQIKDIEKYKIRLSGFELNTGNLASRIQSALDNHRFTLNLGDINTQNVVSQMQQSGVKAGNSFADGFNSGMSTITTHTNNAANTIKHMQDTLASMKFDGSSIDLITKDLESMNLAVSRVRTAINNDNLVISIRGIDELQRAVTIVKQFDYSTGEISTIGKTINQTFDGGAEGAKQFQKEINAVFSTLIGKQKEINSLKVKLEGLDKASLEYAEIKKQIDALGESYVALREVFDGNFSSEQLERLSQEFENGINKINVLRASASQKVEFGITTGKFETEFKSIESKFNGLNSQTDVLKKNFDDLRNAFNTLNDPSASEDSRINALRTYQELLPVVTSQVSKLELEERKRDAAAKSAQTAQQTLLRSSKLSNDIQTWMNNNTKATERFGDKLRDIQSQLKNNTDPTSLKQLSYEFANIKSEAKMAGLTTASFATSLKNVALQVTGMTSAVAIFRKVMQEVKEGVQTVVDLDTALIDLKKTSTASASELKDFYYDANEMAKQLGVTTKEIIQGAADWSRLGFDIGDAKTMSRVSAIFNSISPDINMEQSTDALVSAMKAFKIEADDALDGIASKINIVGKMYA